MESKKNNVLKFSSLLSRQTQMYLADALHMFGIGAGQAVFLDAVARNPGLSMAELSQLTGFDAGTTTRAIGKLAAQGYVEVVRDAQDRRICRASLTPKGMPAATQSRSAKKSWRKIITRGMNDEEKKLAGELLARMSMNAQAYLQWQREQAREKE